MHVAEQNGKDRLGICMQREAPLGGACLVCLTLSDSQRVRSRSPLRWRKRLMSFIDHRLYREQSLHLFKTELLLTSRLQQVK